MPPERKRKSGQGAIAAGPAHGKAPKLEDYLKGNRPQHVKMLSEWMPSTQPGLSPFIFQGNDA